MEDESVAETRGIVKAVLGNPWVRFIALLLLIFLALQILQVVSSVLIPFALALIAAYIFSPVVDWLESTQGGSFQLRKKGAAAPGKLGRGVAVGVLVFAFVALIIIFLKIAIPNAIATMNKLLTAENMNQVVQILPKEPRAFVEKLRDAKAEQRTEMIKRLLGDLVESRAAADAIGQGARTVVVSTLTAIVWVFQFFLFFVVTIYLLIDIGRVRKWVDGALPLRYKPEIIRIARRIDLNIKAFFRGQVVVVSVLSIIFTIGLAIVGCPFWYVVGITGGLGAFVPYFWLASGMVPAMVLAAAAYQDWWHPIAAAVVFAIGSAVDNIIVTPKVIGKSVGMHPVIIILSIMVFGSLFGFLGMLFAIPIAAIVKVLFQELFQKYKQSELYTGRPAQSE